MRLLYAPHMRILLALVVALSTVHSAYAESQLTIHRSFPRAHGLTGHVTVYLPDGYAQNPKKHYPTLVLLHGLGGSDRDWVSHGNMKQTLDRAIAQGAIEPLIAVAPDGQNGYWSDWPDGRIEHKFATLVTRDLIPWVEMILRTDGRRAIVGVSMGGFGALSLALQEPAIYPVVGSLSGALFQLLPTDRPVYRRAFGDDPKAAERFKAINPTDLIRTGKAKGLAIWLDCGRNDRAKFVVGMMVAAQALVDQGMKFQMRLRDGVHTWEVWRHAFADMLPWLGKALKATPQG
jgi:enterochelin esterase family protein